MSQTLGLVVPYSPEYKGSVTDDGLLGRIATMTGGRTLALENTAAAFEHNIDAVKSTTDLWPLLVLLAVLLLPFDIGVRRVSVSKVDILNAWGDVRRRLGWQPQPQAASASTSTPEMAALFGAKERGKRTMDDRRQPIEARVPPVLGGAGEGKAQNTDVVVQPALNAEPEKPTASSTSVIEDAGEESLATRLRRAREQRR
jgi:hypothetical protein